MNVFISVLIDTYRLFKAIAIIMFYLASTRFNDSTWEENRNYRKKKDTPTVLYGTSIKINKKYPPGVIMFVIEMNNEKNEILGIGLIRNLLVLDKKHPIYSAGDYNRYIYGGDYWISREDLLLQKRYLVEILDTILFKGKSHLKRQSGISVLTPKLFTNWGYVESEVKEDIKQIFVQQIEE